jgi:hypothetical protein
MAEASFTLRAVDATKAAFASVQNSLGKLEKSTQSISKITKLAFGGEAVMGALNMMKQRLDKVATAGEEIGFSDEQIVAAMQMENLVENTLNLFMKLPLALAQVGISIGNAFTPLTKDEIKQKLDDLKFVKFRKEIEASGATLAELKKDFDQIGMSQEQLTAAKKNLAETLGAELEAMRGKGDPVATAKKEVELQKILNDLRKDEVSETEKLKKLTEQLGVVQSQTSVATIEQLRENLQADKMRVSDLLGAREDFGLRRDIPEENTQIQIRTKEQLLELLPRIQAREEKINALMKEQNRLFDDAGQILATGFEDAILSGQKLSDTLRAIGQDLVRLVFSNMITQPLAKGIGTFLSGMRAEGGPVNAGGAYMVGEKGPELFVPHASGSIVPNNKMSGGGSGSGGVTVNYNIAAGVSRAELVPILDQERRRLKAEIPDMVRRGGGYRAAFA